MQPATGPTNASSVRGFAYLGLLAFLFFQAGRYASSRHALPTTTPSSWLPLPSSQSDPETLHPITKLMDDAERTFRTKLARQSRTLADAAAEYTRRHKRPPPKGFDAWWKFANDHGVLLVDEFDSTVSDLEPFWALSSAELRQRAREVADFPGMDIVRIRGGKASAVSFRNGVETQEFTGRAAGFMAMLAPFVTQVRSKLSFCNVLI